MSEHIVLIGAGGWQHEKWVGEFYPDDLPDEWQLGYYGNEYQVVLVPASYWSANESTFKEWLEESDESLRMVFEWPDQGANETDTQQAQTALQLLSDRVISILIPLHSEVTESEYAIYKDLALSYPVCFDVAVEKRAQLLPWLAEWFGGDDYSICWHADEQSKQDLGKGTVTITRMSAELAPKDLRAVMETILAEANPERHMVLIVDGDPPSMQLLTNAGIILDLL